MKKLLTIISLIGLLALPAAAQTNSSPAFADTNIVGTAGSQLLNFLFEATNLMVAPYGIISTDGKKFGGGVALAYKLSDVIVPTVRLDYYDRQIWMPSASIQLQAPVTIAGKITVIPFVFSGVATALGGSSSGVSSGDVVGMFGAGGAIRLGSKWDFVADYEKWTGFTKDQIRVGFLYKF